MEGRKYQLFSTPYMMIVYLWGEHTCMMERGDTNGSYTGIHTTNKDNTLTWVTPTVTQYQVERTYTTHTCTWGRRTRPVSGVIS